MSLNGLDRGAGRGSRTPKTRRSADFESAASASSAIPASGRGIHRLAQGCVSLGVLDTSSRRGSYTALEPFGRSNITYLWKENT